MKKIKLSNASRSLAQYTTELEDDIVIVTEGNRALAALVPLKNVDGESLALSSHPEFLKLIDRARKDFAQGNVVSLDEIRSGVRHMRSPKSAVHTTSRTRRRKKTVPKKRARRG